MSVIGIDISKAKFDVCCLFDDGKKRSKVFKNNASGFEEFITWVGRLDLEDPHFCMEATGCYGEALAEFLFEKNHKVSIVNP
jgi:transposase